MNNEKSRAEQEQQAEADARNGGYHDPNGGQYYQNADNKDKTQNQPPE